MNGTALVVRAYRWTCPHCTAANLSQTALLAVRCPACQGLSQVNALHFCHHGALVGPGTPPRQAGVRLQEGDSKPGSPEVDLTAAGYVWACPACGPEDGRLQPAAGLTDQVRCRGCGAVCAVLEIRHRTALQLDARTMLGAPRPHDRAKRGSTRAQPPAADDCPADWHYFKD